MVKYLEHEESVPPQKQMQILQRRGKIPSNDPTSYCVSDCENPLTHAKQKRNLARCSHGFLCRRLSMTETRSCSRASNFLDSQPTPHCPANQSTNEASASNKYSKLLLFHSFTFIILFQLHNNNILPINSISSSSKTFLQHSNSTDKTPVTDCKK